jgi:inosine-uridine nucleoside N-ribohydrolase
MSFLQEIIEFNQSRVPETNEPETNELIRKPEQVIIIGDFFKDLDDEHALLGAIGLLKLGLIVIKCIVANLNNSTVRACGVKGMLNQLGYPDIQVGIGSNGGILTDKYMADYERKIPYMANISELYNNGMDPVNNGYQLLVETLESCSDKSVILVLNSSMTDALRLIKIYPNFKNKIKHVSIMGGLKTDANGLVTINIDGKHFVTPDSAANNAFDNESALQFILELQRLDIPMIVTTRELAYGAQAPMTMYANLKATNTLIADSLDERSKDALTHLFWRTHLDNDDPRREGMPLKPDWFYKVFCNNIEPTDIYIGPTDELDRNWIWKHVEKFQLYDPLNLYASIPVIKNHFFEPYTFGNIHQIIGLSKTVNGLKEGVLDDLIQFMIDVEVYGLNNEH